MPAAGAVVYGHWPSSPWYSPRAVLTTSSEANITVRSAELTDAEAIARIYNYYVEETIVTFEEQPVSAEDMGERVREVHAVSLPWLVAERGGIVVGYAYASKWKGRCAYRFSVEVTVYLERELTGRGIGSLLYRYLLPDLESRGLHVALGGIALPNDASVALQERFGFEKVAHLREVGFKFNRWIDVGYWQKILAVPRNEIVAR
jgi:phosphinothricin acetyltransferase